MLPTPLSGTDEGITLAEDLRASHPDIGVVVLSQFPDPIYALALFDRGSDGRAYLLKERVHNRAELTAAVDAMADGGSMLDSKIVDGLVRARPAADRSALDELTAREREVLSEIAQGKSNMAIAESLFLSARAVEKHIDLIFLKLGLAEAEDRRELTRQSDADAALRRDRRANRHSGGTWVVGRPSDVSMGNAVPIRVVLADDSLVVRDVLAQILNRSPDIDVVATAVDEPTLLTAIEETRPDVVVTDVRMPPTGTDEGVRVAGHLAMTQPDIGVVIVSQYSDPGWLSRVFDFGRENRGWVIKERAYFDGQLVRAVKTVHQGDRWIDPSVMAPE